MNSAGRFEGEGADAPFRIEGSYLARFDYCDRIERDGLTMVFHSRHRPLADYFAAFAASGLVVETLREPAVPDSAVTSPALSSLAASPALSTRARASRLTGVSPIVILSVFPSRRSSGASAAPPLHDHPGASASSGSALAVAFPSLPPDVVGGPEDARGPLD